MVRVPGVWLLRRATRRADEGTVESDGHEETSESDGHEREI
ncbi:hypothetical protein SAMN04488124_2396 [Halogeometricum limi]|uniref:Uncharacterized protein n=1 Tax=Halogeometricum limi TaxID=555875 RepID=A0A1I6HMU2_9EURY|nr:hypothetical protein SAMN04488124_2396 [Halogeometricum limi]